MLSSPAGADDDVEERNKHLALVLEIGIDRLNGDAGFVGDGLHGGPAIAAFGEEFVGRPQDALARIRGLGLPPCRIVFPCGHNSLCHAS